MMLNDLMTNPLKDLVEQCTIVKVSPYADDSGKIVKLIIEYVPHDEEAKKSF